LSRFNLRAIIWIPELAAQVWRRRFMHDDLLLILIQHADPNLSGQHYKGVFTGITDLVDALASREIKGRLKRGCPLSQQERGIF
jgi:hypothetical protein